MTAVVSLGGLTVIAFLDRFSSYLELAGFFRLQYAVLLAAAALAGVALRLFRVALVALVLAVMNLLVIAPAGPAPQTEASGSARLRLLVVNVRHDNHEYGAVVRLIAENDPDIVGLTELTPAWARGLKTALERFPSRRLQAEEGAYGIGLYSKLPIARATVERFPKDGPPSIVATVALAEMRIRLVLVHVHTPFAGAIHERQLAALGRLRARPGGRLVVCGDFNAVPWSQPMRDLASATGLRSVENGFDIHGTWPTWSSLLRVPIDNCLVSDGLAVVRRHAGSDVGSDHFPLIVELGLARSPTQRTPVQQARRPRRTSPATSCTRRGQPAAATPPRRGLLPGRRGRRSSPPSRGPATQQSLS
jgi:endonuclease/exonuclease/phosphatase (EEP) superfamily protein YafD